MSSCHVGVVQECIDVAYYKYVLVQQWRNPKTRGTYVVSNMVQRTVLESSPQTSFQPRKIKQLCLSFIVPKTALLA